MNAPATTPDVIRVSFIPSHTFHGDVPSHRCTFDALERELRKHGQTVEQKQGVALVVSTFRKGDGTTPSTRGKVGAFRQEALIDETWLLGLDFDTRSGDPDAIVAPLVAAGLDVIAYSSHSHGRFAYLQAKVRKELAGKLAPEALDREVERRARAPRFRVLVRTSRSITRTEYRALWAWLDRYLGGGSDGACSDPTRLYFTPRRKAPDAELDPWVTRWRGGPLDPDRLPDGTTVAELLDAARAAGAPSPRAELAPAEQDRRRREVQALPQGARTKAARRAQRILEATLDRLQTKTEGGRRMGLFAAACRIGEWSEVIGDDGVKAWRKALLDSDAVAKMPDRHDHARQVDNGIHRGRANPVDVRADLERRPRTLPILENGATAPLPLDDARARLVELVAEAVQTRGAVAIAADPGVGKTRAILELLPRMWLEGMTVRLAVPTNKLAAEVLREVHRVVVESDLSTKEADAFLGNGGHDPLVGIEPKRHAGNCQNFAAVNAGRRAGGIDGAHEVCRRCDLHPSNGGGKRDCRFFAEVMDAQDYRVTITTHALEVLRTTARSATTVDVAAFRKAQRTQGTRWVPHARWTPDGLTLTIKEDDRGTAPPTLEGAPDEVEAQCRSWLAGADGLPSADDLETLRVKLAPLADGETDLLVIDEAPRAADEQRAVGETDLLVWRGAGDVVMTDEAMDAFRALMTAAVADDRSVGPSELAAALPPEALRVRRDDEGRAWSKVGRALVAEHAADAARGAIPSALADAPDAEALEALEAACRRGWTGCYVAAVVKPRAGDDEAPQRAVPVLHIIHPRTIGGEGVRSTVYLDGTATEATARAMLGGGCRYERIRAALHPDTRVVRVDWSAASRELPRRPCERTTSKRRATLQRLAAVVKRYETPTTAWVLHKAWCDDDEVRGLLRDAFDAGRVVYFRAPEATGSNKLAACTRIVLADWFVPRAAVAALADTLQDRAGRAEVDADWNAEARHQTEGAELLQAAYRVRPVQNARELVWLSEREPPEAMGWPAAEVIDPDELVADELGLLPGGRKGAAMLLAREVRRWGVVALGRRFKTTPHLAYSLVGDEGRGPETALERAALHWRDSGRAAAWAEAAGVRVAYCRTADGGAPFPVFFAADGPPPDAATVARAMPPTRWLEWQGVRLELEDQTAPLLALLVALPLDVAATFDELAARSGVSVSTVRRRLASAGLRSVDDLRAYRQRVQTPDHVAADADDEGERVALVGSAVWLQLAAPAAVRRWRQLTGPPPLGTGAEQAA